jgi:hypothetical protein
MTLLALFLAATTIFGAVRIDLDKQELDRQILYKNKIVQMCGDKWLKKPLTMQDMIDFEIIEPIEKK